MIAPRRPAPLRVPLTARLAARLGWPASAAARREARSFYLFASPFLVGLLFFTVGPILVSLYLGFTNYDAAGWPPAGWGSTTSASCCSRTPTSGRP